MLSVFQAAEQHASALALVTESQHFTFAELATRVEDTARGLGSIGVLDARAPVALVARPSLSSLEVLHALIAYGVPILLLHPRLPTAERQRLVERVAASTLLIPDETPLAATRTRAPPLPTELDALTPLAIVRTSGTGGTPKLALLSRRACTASARASIESLGLSHRDRWLLCLPVAHVGGLSIVTRSLLAGSAVVGFDPGSAGLLPELPKLARRLARDQVSVASFVPAVLDGLLRLEPRWQPDPHLRAVLVGGAATSVGLFERASARGVPVRTTYGLTEACSQATASSAQRPPRVAGGVVSSGRALSNVELSVRDDGRLQLRGPTLFSGYFGDSTAWDATHWFVTDDLGRLEPDGELFVLGRASELIITGGENVDPRRVEAELEKEPGIQAAVVFGIPDDRFGQIVACALVTTPDLDLDLGRVARRLSNELSRHELPRRVACGALLHLLPNGKIDRVRMREAAVTELLPWNSSS